MTRRHVRLDWYTARSGTWLAPVTSPYTLTATVGIDRSSCTLRWGGGEAWQQWGREAARYIEPGRHCLVASTARRYALGEWVMTRSTWDSDSAEVTVEGRGWADILGGNSVWTSSAKWGRTAGWALAECIRESLSGITAEIVVADETPGLHIEPRRGELVSSTMSQITSSDRGARWYMESVVEHDRDRGPRRVARRALVRSQVGRGSGWEVLAGTPGSQQGNAVISGGYDWTRTATRVAGQGTGSGDKQVWALRQDTRLTATGMLARDVTRSWGDVRDRAALERLVQGELAARQDFRLPMTASLRLSDWEHGALGMPTPPDTVRVYCPPTFGWPDGLDEAALVVAETRFTIQDGVLTKYDITLGEDL